MHNTPYACVASLGQVINKLEDSTIKLFNLFSNNYLKANKDKPTSDIATKLKHLLT